MSSRCSNVGNHFVLFPHVSTVIFLASCWESYPPKNELRSGSPQYPWDSGKKRSVDGASRRSGKLDGNDENGAAVQVPQLILSLSCLMLACEAMPAGPRKMRRFSLLGCFVRSLPSDKTQISLIVSTPFPRVLFFGA